jgi:hypothetical protein
VFFAGVRAVCVGESLLFENAIPQASPRRRQCSNCEVRTGCPNRAARMALLVGHLR